MQVRQLHVGDSAVVYLSFIGLIGRPGRAILRLMSPSDLAMDDASRQWRVSLHEILVVRRVSDSLEGQASGRASSRDQAFLTLARGRGQIRG